MPQHPTAPVEYREIPRFEGYRFGSDGSVWSSWRKGRPLGNRDEWYRLNPVPDKDGYPHTRLRTAPGVYPRVGIHRLILEAFVGPRPQGMECRHLDNDPSNNRLDNLEWSTHVDNIADKQLHGTHQAGEKHAMHKLTEAQVLEVRRAYAAGESGPSLGARYGVHKSTITRAAMGESWKCLDDVPPA